jgi:hypothetical protein
MWSLSLLRICFSQYFYLSYSHSLHILHSLYNLLSTTHAITQCYTLAACATDSIVKQTTNR